MMKRLVCICVLLVLLLSGCQLARADAEELPTKDLLVGVMVTREYLDLFDIEGYLNDNASALLGDSDHVIEDTTGYEKRIYANMENGSCVFDQVDGILFAAYEFDEETQKGVRVTPCNEISDGHINTEETEGFLLTTMEGTIFVDDRIGEVHYVFNPVYQDESGNVYLTSGSGLGSNIEPGIGTKMSHNISDEFEINQNGRTEGFRTEIKINVEAVSLAEKYVLVSMDQKHNELTRTEFAAEAMPENVSPAEGAAYLLVEIWRMDTEGEESVTRTIHTADDEDKTFEIYLALEDGVCVQEQIEILWK